MYRLIPLLLVLLLGLIDSPMAQMAGKLSLTNSTLVSTSEEMPFWFWANTDGKTAAHNSVLNLSEMEAEGTYRFAGSKSYIKAGTTLLTGLSKNSYLQPNQLFARLHLNNWELNAGLYTDEMLLGGLSGSNGNLAKSRNARPYPRIGIRVADFKPVPFAEKSLSFKGEYNEGLLLDERYVDKTHLHHKSFYLKFKFNATLNLQAGFEHFAMWGGTSRNPAIGNLPNNLKAYWKYLRGANGGEDFPETDQLNVAGNSFGTYQFLLTKKWGNVVAALNISHPFEDYSGINWRNWPDNLIGLHLEFLQPQAFISEILYEYTNTRQQGITDSLYRWEEEKQAWKRVHDDNYFNHGIYHSGLTHYGQALVSPFFYPVKKQDGISTGFASTRFYAHHLGAKGHLTPVVAWKGLLSYVKHFGTYAAPYITGNRYVFGFLEIMYSSRKWSLLTAGLSISADLSDSTTDKAGVQLKIRRQW